LYRSTVKESAFGDRYIDDSVLATGGQDVKLKALCQQYSQIQIDFNHWVQLYVAAFRNNGHETVKRPMNYRFGY
jgi:hypothetical protein